MTRAGLSVKEVGTQLIEYCKISKSSGLQNSVCFVYDPEGFISNPMVLKMISVGKKIVCSSKSSSPQKFDDQFLITASVSE